MATATPDPILNEVLLRFSAFGLSGAHFRPMIVATDPFTGQQTEQVGPPQPIYGFPALQSVLGDALTQAIEGNNQLQANLATANAELDTVRADLASAQAQVARLQQQAADQADQLAAAQSTIAQLQAQLDAATSPPAAEPDAGETEQPTDQPA